MPLGCKIRQDDPNKKAFAEEKVQVGTYIVLCPFSVDITRGTDTRRADFSSMSPLQNTLDCYTGSLLA